MTDPDLSPEAVDNEPSYFAVETATGVHIGMWRDRELAVDVLNDFSGGRLVELVPRTALTASEARAERAEAAAAQAREEALREAADVGRQAAHKINSALLVVQPGETTMTGSAYVQAAILAPLSSEEERENG